MAIVFSVPEQIQIALALGYERVPDEEAYTSAYYVKNGMKWIFNIVGLKKTLNVSSDDELKQQDYDVETYYEVRRNYNKYKDMISDNDLSTLYEDLRVTDDPDEYVYLADGMWMNGNGDLVER
ncbi:TPA: hypothetical protein ACJJYX_004276 [Enterobacter cloacae]|jgi:hypothetical protein